MKAILRGQLPAAGAQFSSSRYRNCGVRVRVLFVSQTNSSRSQMAEAFANYYGSDVLRAASVGIRPAPQVSAATREVMREKNIEIPDRTPKGLDWMNLEHFDLIVNLSGNSLPDTGPAPVLSFSVPDPTGRDQEIFREVRDRIDYHVTRLVRDLRRACVKYKPPSQDWQMVFPPKAVACY